MTLIDSESTLKADDQIVKSKLFTELSYKALKVFITIKKKIFKYGIDIFKRVLKII